MVLDISPLDFLKEELKVETTAQRIENVHRLKLVAAALGPARVVSELLPFLQELQKCDDDELIHALAEEYAVLTDFIGGEQNFQLLVPHLEYLASQEETVVREKAVESLCIICEKASEKVRQQLVQEKVFPVAQKLATGDWFTNRVSSCGLFAACYKSANEPQRAELRKLYHNLCNDDTPMVRRAAAAKMKDVFKVVEKQYVLNDLIGVFKALAQDDTQDSIRVSCLMAALELAKILSPEETKQHALPIITQAADDRSWRVRLHLAKSIDTLTKALGQEITSSFVLTPFQTLLKDPESDVRTAAVLSIEKCLEDLSVDQLQTVLIPSFQALAVDSSQAVRAALANVVGPVARKLGREQTQKSLLNLIMDLTKDDFHDVRLNMVVHAGPICEVLGADALAHSLLTTVQGLITDSQWRIRLSVVDQIPRLAKHFGPDLFQSKLEALFMSSLTDSVHTVREATIKNIPVLAEVFGPEWASDHLLNNVLEQFNKAASYSHRMTALHAIVPLSSVITHELVDRNLAPVVVKAMKDPVPNVRFAAALTAAALAEKGLATQADILPALEELIRDQDIDVQYFAVKAYTKCKNSER